METQIDNERSDPHRRTLKIPSWTFALDSVYRKKWSPSTYTECTFLSNWSKSLSIACAETSGPHRRSRGSELGACLFSNRACLKSKTTFGDCSECSGYGTWIRKRHPAVATELSQDRELPLGSAGRLGLGICLRGSHVPHQRVWGLSLTSCLLVIASRRLLAEYLSCVLVSVP